MMCKNKYMIFLNDSLTVFAIVVLGLIANTLFNPLSCPIQTYSRDCAIFSSSVCAALIFGIYVLIYLFLEYDVSDKKC